MGTDKQNTGYIAENASKRDKATASLIEKSMSVEAGQITFKVPLLKRMFSDSDTRLFRDAIKNGGVKGGIEYCAKNEGLLKILEQKSKDNEALSALVQEAKEPVRAERAQKAVREKRAIKKEQKDTGVKKLDSIDEKGESQSISGLSDSIDLSGISISNTLTSSKGEKSFREQLKQQGSQMSVSEGRGFR